MFEQISLLSIIEDKINDNTEKNNDIDKTIHESSEEEYAINEEVYVEYKGVSYIGRICRIYNEGNSLSCSFDGRQTCFHKSRVRKIK